MSSIPRFIEYAAAFEKAFESDDWSLIEPFFSEDAVYDVGLGPPFTPDTGSEIRGRDAVLAFFKQVLDAFDRRFETRRVTLLEGPRDDGDSVWVLGRASYTHPEVPDLEFDLEETATFDGDRICRLEDRYDDAAVKSVRAYFEEHGARLGLG